MPASMKLTQKDRFQRALLGLAVDEVAGGCFLEKREGDIRGSGDAVRSLEAALWAFANSSSFAEGCLKAVNLGEDADTTAAVYGQLAGAFYGRAGIHGEWVRRLAKRDDIERIASGLYEYGTGRLIPRGDGDIRRLP